MAESPDVIVVRPDEGAVVLYGVGDGTEPPPHVVLYNLDGTLKNIVPPPYN